MEQIIKATDRNLACNSYYLKTAKPFKSMYQRTAKNMIQRPTGHSNY